MCTGSAEGGNSGSAGRRVLVVEDDDEMRTLLCEVLRAHGFEPHAAADDSQAFLRLREVPVDVVVLDKTLPGPSGLEILPKIRRLYPDVRVILVTAFGDEGTAGRARERGATEFLPKPFRMADLLRLLGPAPRRAEAMG